MRRRTNPENMASDVETFGVDTWMAKVDALTAENERMRKHVSTALAALDLAPDESRKSPWVAVTSRELRRALAKGIS